METAENGGVRVPSTASLGKARMPMPVDVGFGDPVAPGASVIRLPTVLDFPAPERAKHGRERSVAEKLQITVRLGEINSRMQDFSELWLLATRDGFGGEILGGTIQVTFRQRGTPVPAAPTAFGDAFVGDPERQVQWAAFLRRYRLSRAAGVPATLREAMDVITAFLTPVLAAVSDGRRFKKRWSPGGPWMSSGSV